MSENYEMDQNEITQELQIVRCEKDNLSIVIDQHNILSETDVAGKITSVNDKFCEISGYSREELLGKNHRILKSGCHPAAFYDDLWSTISQGKVWHGRVCNRTKNGGEYWVESTIVPFLDDKGKPYKYVSARTDITATQQNEERLNRSQMFANIGTWDWNIRTGELYWSERIGPLFGYQDEVPETSYENFLAAVHPEDRQSVVDAVNDCVENGAEYDIEHRVVWPDGSEHWVQEKGNVIRADNGEPLHMLGVVQDITKRILAETQHREIEQRFVFAVEGAGDGVWDWDIPSSSMQFSRLYMEMLGYAENELPNTAHTWVNSVHPDDLSRVQEILQDYLEDRIPAYIVELRLRCKDGSYKWVLCRGTIVSRDTDGNPLRLIGIHTDISKKKHSEIKQKGYNSILELVAKGSLLSEVLEAVVLHAEEMMDDSYCSILLLDKSGKHLGAGVAPSLPDYYNEAIDGVEIGMGVGSCGEAAFTGKRVIVGDVNTHPNWVNFRELTQKAGLHACWSEPFFSSSGATLGTFAIYYPEPREPDDIDLDFLTELAQFSAIAVERDQGRQALMDTKEEAEQANLAKSQFLSSMSHELRTPLNAIMGFGQLLQMDSVSALTQSQSENVSEIVKAGDHLLRLINEVLDLARIEAGRIDLSIEAVELGSVISESLQLILPLAEKRGIKIKLIQQGDDITLDQLSAPRYVVRADHTRLKQVLLNLLSNAVKYNRENGKLTIACHHVNNSQTRISVSDTGEGITLEQQGQLFKAFSRLGSDQSDVEGTGIGLVITKNIIELMGGKIGVDSQPGKGSTFWVELPSDTLPSEQINMPNDNETAVSQAVISTGHEHTVLYIEDNPANLRLVTQLLGRLSNIHMWSAHEPGLGLELAAEHRPDLILLDINLPGMNGYEVLKKLRQEEATCNTPVIAISANAMPKDIDKGMEAGFDNYITKPIDVTALLEAVESKLTSKR